MSAQLSLGPRWTDLGQPAPAPVRRGETKRRHRPEPRRPTWRPLPVLMSTGPGKKMQSQTVNQRDQLARFIGPS